LSATRNHFIMPLHPRKRRSLPAYLACSIMVYIYCHTHTARMMSFHNLLQTLYQMALQCGKLVMPMTGVAHVKASAMEKGSVTSKSSTTKDRSSSLILPSSGGTDSISTTTTSLFNKLVVQAPITVSIICDNQVDTWQFQVYGYTWEKWPIKHRHYKKCECTKCIHVCIVCAYIRRRTEDPSFLGSQKSKYGSTKTLTRREQ
jgi:hypothetical protein